MCSGEGSIARRGVMELDPYECFVSTKSDKVIRCIYIDVTYYVTRIEVFVLVDMLRLLY